MLAEIHKSDPARSHTGDALGYMIARDFGTRPRSGEMPGWAREWGVFLNPKCKDLMKDLRQIVSDHQKTYFSEHQAGRAGRACGALGEGSRGSRRVGAAAGVLR